MRRAAYDLLQNPVVIDYAAELRRAVAAKFEVKAVDMLRLWWRIANADPNRIMRHRRICCRHCHGVGHAYQWRDLEEFAQALETEALAAAAERREPIFPSDNGGYGYRRPEPPAADCPFCFGEGHGDVWITDTGNLDADTLPLYAGVKQTKDGIQILTRDQDRAAENIARYLGMFHDRQPGAANGNPIPPAVTLAAKSPDEAAKFYKQLMG